MKYTMHISKHFECVFLRQAGIRSTQKTFLPQPQLVFEVMKMDSSTETIKDLFYKQIKELTLRTQDSFDLQFSGKLLEKKVGGKNGRRI